MNLSKQLFWVFIGQMNITVGGFTGEGTDWLTQASNPHNGIKFTTKDNDNDTGGHDCAARYKSGWWYLPNRQPPQEYPLTVGGFTGESTDWFTQASNPHNGLTFTTKDNDDDKGGHDCAASYKSGWWYNAYDCHYVNSNRQPLQVNSYVLFTEMKIRPKDCITH